MPDEPLHQMSKGVRELLVQGAPLYRKTLVAIRHFNAEVYEICQAVFTRNADKLGGSIGVGDLGSKEIRPHLFPAMGPDAPDWDGTEA